MKKRFNLIKNIVYALALSSLSSCCNSHNCEYNLFQYDTTSHWFACQCANIDESTVKSHSFVDMNDSVNHWKECECGYVCEKGAHYYDSFEQNDSQHWQRCNCGYTTTPENHVYDGDYITYENDHYKVCSVCNVESQHTTHVCDQEIVKEQYFCSEANYKSPAKYYKSCVCGFTNYKETFEHGNKIAHEHVFGDYLNVTDTTHTRICDLCALEVTSNHIYNQECVSNEYLCEEANYTHSTSYYKSCVCGSFLKDANNIFYCGDPIPHDHKYDYKGQCKYCSESLPVTSITLNEEKNIPALKNDVQIFSFKAPKTAVYSLDATFDTTYADCNLAYFTDSQGNDVKLLSIGIKMFLLNKDETYYFGINNISNNELDATVSISETNTNFSGIVKFSDVYVKTIDGKDMELYPIDIKTGLIFKGMEITATSVIHTANNSAEGIVVEKIYEYNDGVFSRDNEIDAAFVGSQVFAAIQPSNKTYALVTNGIVSDKKVEDLLPTMCANISVDDDNDKSTNIVLQENTDIHFSMYVNDNLIEVFKGKMKTYNRECISLQSDVIPEGDGRFTEVKFVTPLPKNILINTTFEITFGPNNEYHGKAGFVDFYGGEVYSYHQSTFFNGSSQAQHQEQEYTGNPIRLTDAYWENSDGINKYYSSEPWISTNDIDTTRFHKYSYFAEVGDIVPTSNGYSLIAHTLIANSIDPSANKTTINVLLADGQVRTFDIDKELTNINTNQSNYPVAIIGSISNIIAYSIVAVFIY